MTGNTPRIRGYTDRPSIAQGERIRFHLSNVHGGDTVRRSIRVFHVGIVDTEVASDTVDVPAQPVIEQGWNDNRWSATHELLVDRRWKAGVYVARIGEHADDSRGIYFVVRDPGAPIVIQLPTSTINAYNNWGGASLYGYNSGGTPASAVSFDRPQQSDPAWPRGYGFEDEWELRIKPLVQWMELCGLRADFMTSTDLHRGASLQRYALFISVGHDEYWSHEMREHFDVFIAGGGNAAIFGGNTCHWQTRFEPDDRRQVCFKNAGADPCADSARKTVLWRDVGRPENLSFGAGGAAGAWQGTTAKPGVFEVAQPDHWIFDGTALRRGDPFGRTADEAIVRYETNGVRVDRADGTPHDYRILAFADLPDWGTPGNAALGVLTHASGGTVFNAATTEWATGLASCITTKDPLRTVTAKITKNVITRLAGQAGG